MTNHHPLHKAVYALLFLPLTCAAQRTKAPEPAPQMAYVTIYSHPITLTSFMPGNKNSFYSGRIYEGDHRLAHIGPSHFVTFTLRPGSHTFAANSLTSSSSAGGGAVTLDLQPGHRYFLQASVHFAVTASGMAFILKEVPCDEARQSNEKSKALSAKDLFPEGQKLVDADTAFPTCSATVPETPLHWSTQAPTAPAH